MVNYRQQWADGEIEAGTLLDAIDALAQRCRELEHMLKHAAVERLRTLLARTYNAWLFGDISVELGREIGEAAQ